MCGYYCISKIICVCVCLCVYVSVYRYMCTYIFYCKPILVGEKKIHVSCHAPEFLNRNIQARGSLPGRHSLFCGETT